MSLHVNADSGSDFELLPPDIYIARCYRIIDLGTQTVTGIYGTQQKPKVMISWEILDDPKMEDGRPFSVHSNYTASLDPKSNLFRDLESWRGQPFTDDELADFDLTNVLGTYCQVNVVHSKDGKFVNVKSVVKAKFSKDEKGNYIKPAPINDNVLFDIEKPDMKVFEALSDGMQKKIMAAPEWNKKSEPTAQVDDVVITDIGEGEPVNIDDIPF